jgi:Alpha-2,8-polysialyltransferase (POLYST)
VSGTQTIRRLVACQGSLQVVTALSALRQRERDRAGGPHRTRDVLVIYDLYAPAAQMEDFRNTLRQLARAGGEWEDIICLEPAEIDRWCGLVRTQGLRRVRREVAARLGGRDFDELFLARNWQPGNRLMMNCHPQVECVCYGDAIGVYFTELYFRPPARPAPAGVTAGLLNPSWRERISAARGSLYQFLHGPTTLREVTFGSGCLVAPDLFGEKAPFPVSITDRELLRDTCATLAQRLHPAASPALRTRTRPCALVLTSNFSEAGAMTLEGELAAYRAFMADRVPASASIVLKPHPRDSHEKIVAFGEALRGDFAAVHVLDDPQLFYVPFELFLLTAFSDSAFDLGPELQLVCFSSACLGPAFLFDLRSEVGFGPELVNRYFDPALRERRLGHEADLAAAMTRLRTDRSAA